MTVRLVQYLPGATEPEILDEGTIGTRGPRAGFLSAVDRLAMRFVRDAALGRSRGPAAVQPAARARGLPGWLDHLHATWHDRVMTEWWSLGSTDVSLQQVLAGGGLNSIRWYSPEVGRSYLADPFPLAGDRPHPVRGHAADRRRRPDRCGVRSRGASVAADTDPGGRFPPLLPMHLAGRRALPIACRNRPGAAPRAFTGCAMMARWSRSATSHRTPGWLIRHCFSGTDAIGSAAPTSTWAATIICVCLHAAAADRAHGSRMPAGR